MPSPSKPLVKTLRVRIKDRHDQALLTPAGEVLTPAGEVNRFMLAFDMDKFTRGASRVGLNLQCQAIQAISEEYCSRRLQFKKKKRHGRASIGSRRVLEWILFKASALRDQGGPLRYGTLKLGVLDSDGLSGRPEVRPLNAGILGLEAGEDST